jgi:hypothetical protein
LVAQIENSLVFFFFFYSVVGVRKKLVAPIEKSLVFFSYSYSVESRRYERRKLLAPVETV